MEREHQQLTPYTRAITRWLPTAKIATPVGDRGWDALVTVRQGGRVRRWAAEVRRHVANEDVAVIAARLHAAALDERARPLLLAPYVRVQQAAILERAGVDYVDLAGNVHLEAPDRFVHIEGKRPTDTPRAAVRLTKGWVKTVMALLIEPALLDQPYRTLARAGDVAVGTIDACLKHLRAHRFLAARGANRKLQAVPDLMALWVGAYLDILRPRLAERRFQLPTANKNQIWELLTKTLAQRNIAWTLTGADAAEATDRHFHAEDTELYANTTAFDDRELLLALRAQPAIRGNLLIIEPPGPLALTPALPAPVPAAPRLLQYAELRRRGTEQAREAAEMLLPRVMRDAER